MWQHKRLFLALLLLGAPACLKVDSGEDSPQDGGAGNGGTGATWSGPEVHYSCVRATPFDELHCTDSSYPRAYACDQLLTTNGPCVTATGRAEVPAPGAVIWCCRPSADVDAGAGGSSGGAGTGSGGVSGSGAAGGSTANGGSAGNGASGGVGASAGTGTSGGAGTAGSAGAAGSSGAAGNGGSAGCDAGAPPPSLSGAPTLVATLSGKIRGLAVDASYVYASLTDARQIARVALPSGTAETLYTDTSQTTGVAVTASDVYWTTAAGSLQRAPKSGGGAISLVGSPGFSAECLALDATHAYVARNTSAPVAEVTLATGSVRSLASLDAATGITLIASGDVVVGAPGDQRLWLAPVSAASATEFVSLGSGRQGNDVESDGSYVWVASASSGEILRVAEDCPSVSVALSVGETANVIALALSPTHVYWATFSNQIYSLPR